MKKKKWQDIKTRQFSTRKLTAEGQRFSFWRMLTSSMHIPFCHMHIPFCPTHIPFCPPLVLTSSVHIPFCPLSPLVLTSSMHLGWTTRFWHKILQHILSECITDSSLRKLIKLTFEGIPTTAMGCEGGSHIHDPLGLESGSRWVLGWGRRRTPSF